MTQPEASLPVPDEVTAQTGTGADSVSATPEPEIPAELEPWTPERVSEWNAYYDIYVMLAVLLLAFIVSAVRVDERNSVLWTHLKAGELISQQGSPAVGNPFSYSEPGSTWINIPWLFQWSHAALYRLVRDMVPVDQADPTANLASAEQIAVGSLIAINALARLLTAWILLKIRRPGPGLWWTAICVAMALGVLAGPFGILPGGIAGPGIVGPGTWGLLLLAVEMLLLHRAYNQGRRSALYLLIPLFVLWANVDDSFFMGLIILGATVIGWVLDGRSAHAGDGKDQSPGGAAWPIRPSAGFLALGLCITACLVNPYTYKVFLAAMAPIIQLFGTETELARSGEISYFGKQIQRVYRADWYWFTIFYLTMVCLGLGSFLLNARRFAWSRFLPFAVIAALWAVFMGYRQEYAAVFAVMMGLNGQEWYHDRFGTRGRLGAGWNLWSTGGRLVTLAALFFFVGVSITGWLKLPGQPRFGFTFDPGEFAFEAADFLARRDDLKGNIFNTTAAQGDALIWKAYPARGSFYDDRSHAFSRQLLEEQRALRIALRDDDQPVWKQGLDRYGINTVMIDAEGAPETLKRLSQSPLWIPFYDDGRVVMFGRSDATEPDLTTFKNNRLDPNLRAFRVSAPIPSADRPPTATSSLDEIFQNRLLGRAQPHTNAAVRWLQGSGAEEGQPATPDPARCILAIREARTALSKNPDDWTAYRLLDLSYRLLAGQETALLAGIPLMPENQARISMLAPNYTMLNTRFQQRVTSLNYAIQTTPPPKTAEASRELGSQMLELFQLYMQSGYVDLARDRLQLLLDMTRPSDLAPEARSRYEQQLAQLNERVQQIEENLMNMQVERQAGPVEKAIYARNQGAVGLAISELEEADRGNMSPMIVKPQLVDLFCGTGQPDRAMELLSLGANEDPTLGAEPGTSFLRQGQVYLLLGNYLSAANFWEQRAIPRLRYERSMRALSTAQALGRGDLVTATNNDLSLAPLINRQALWEFELGQCLLESGSPDRAADAFTRSLKLVPDLAYRPIMAYYLEQMGRPVPAAGKPGETVKPAELSPGPGPVPAAPAAVVPPNPFAGPEPSNDAAKKP